MAYPRKVSPDIKKEMIDLYSKGYGLKSIGRIVGLHKSTVRRHVKDLVLVDGIELPRAEHLKIKIEKQITQL